MSILPSMSRDKKKRVVSLRAKTAVGMAVVLLVTVSIYIGTVSFLLLRSFERLQSDLMTQRIDRVLLKLSETKVAQEREVRSKASSDRLFAISRSQARNALDASDFDVASDFGPDLVFFVNRQRNVSGGNRFDRLTKAGSPLPDWLAGLPIRSSGLLSESEAESRYLLHEGQFWLLSACPITRSDGSGPSPGWLVFAQHLDERWLERLRKATSVAVQPAASHSLAGPEPLNFEQAPPGYRVVVPARQPGGDRSAAVEFTTAGAIGQLVLLLEVPAAVYETAIVMRNELIGFSIILSLAVIAAGLLLIEFLFIRRIEKIEADLARLTQSEDAAGRLSVDSNDEFGQLAMSVNRLLSEMRQRRSESEMQRGLLAGVLDSASEGIIAYRAIRAESGGIDDFLVVSANASSARILGRTVASMVGRTILELAPGMRDAGLFEVFRQTVELRRPSEQDILYTADGLNAWFHLAVMPWGDGLVVTFEEITERKKAEEEIRRTLDEIERFNRAMLGREGRILEMKTEVNDLRARLGLPPLYRFDLNSDEA